MNHDVHLLESRGPNLGSHNVNNCNYSLNLAPNSTRLALAQGRHQRINVARYQDHAMRNGLD